MSRHEPRLQLDPRFTHLVEADGSFVLVSDEDSAVLEGSAVAELVPLLDGRRTAIQIAQAVAHRHRPELVHFALLQLEAAGLARPAVQQYSKGPDASLPVAPPAGEGAGQGLKLIASGLQDVWSNRGNRAAVVGQLPGSSLRVVVTDDYLSPDVLAVVTKARGPDALVMTRVGPVDVWVGPIIGGNCGACISCLQERLRINLTARAFQHAAVDEDHLRVEPLPRSIPNPAFTALAEHLYHPESGPLWGPASFCVLGLDGSPAISHRVHRLPACAACGDPLLVPPGADFEITSRPHLAGSSGGYRIWGPQTTWERFSPLISPLTGVVRRVEKVEVAGTDLIHVYTASHAGIYGATSIKAVKDDARDHSGGKGMTDLDARVSALCESLERFSAVHRGKEPSRIVRLSDLGKDGIHPNKAQGFSELQFAGREAWNAGQTGGFQWVPERYEDQEIEWSQVRSLKTGEVSWLPAAMIYLGYRGEGNRFCKGDSNGLAGGNCLEEAVLQGILELVERDGIALWWYNRARVPGVDLKSAQDEYVQRVVQYYPTLRRRLWALDLTTDLGIPCFAALSALEGGEQEDIIFGFGCHLDPDIALRRALTELNQMLPTVERPMAERRKQLLPEFKDAIDWWEAARVVDHPYLEPAPSVPPRNGESHAKPDSLDLKQAIEHCVRRVAHADLDVLVHDLTRSDVGFAAAKVVIPGLRHFWRRLGAGRLYDVPADLGWVDAERSEAEMNPISMFV